MGVAKPREKRLNLRAMPPENPKSDEEIEWEIWVHEAQKTEDKRRVVKAPIEKLFSLITTMTFSCIGVIVGVTLVILALMTLVFLMMEHFFAPPQNS